MSTIGFNGILCDLMEFDHLFLEFVSDVDGHVIHIYHKAVAHPLASCGFIPLRHIDKKDISRSNWGQ